MKPAIKGQFWECNSQMKICHDGDWGLAQSVITNAQIQDADWLGNWAMAHPLTFIGMPYLVFGLFFIAITLTDKKLKRGLLP